MDLIIGEARNIEFFKDKVGDITLKIAGPAKDLQQEINYQDLREIASSLQYENRKPNEILFE